MGNALKNFNSHQFQNYPDNITVLANTNGLIGPDYHYVLHIGAVFSQYSSNILNLTSNGPIKCSRILTTAVYRIVTAIKSELGQ